MLALNDDEMELQTCTVNGWVLVLAGRVHLPGQCFINHTMATENQAARRPLQLITLWS